MRTRICNLIVLVVGVLLSADTCLGAAASDPNQKKDVFELSIDELMNVEVASAATLTETTPRLVPAAMTTITQEQIKASGARSLFELLDIYVPNLQWSHHSWENDQMGLRGIINDRDDKYLLLVNGRNMNQRTHFGALTEQDQVLLSDIHHVEVIRGPGSALYGPGAISMVINIVTFNASNFQGTEVTTRAGVIEGFATGEVKHGEKFIDNDGGIFLYGGLGDYDGANKYNAPQIYPFDFTSVNGWAPRGTVPSDGTKLGQPMTGDSTARDNAAAPHADPAKLHVEINKGNLDIWARYERGGKQFSPASMMLARGPASWADWFWFGIYNNNGRPLPEIYPDFYAYQQLTGFIGYTQELTEKAGIDYAFSYSTISLIKERLADPVDAYREDNLYAKALLKWQVHDNHKIAFGPEYYHFDLGLDPFSGFDYPEHGIQGAASTVSPRTQEWGNGTQMPRWSTDMFSLLGEWQWKITDQLTTFLGGRVDEHTYTQPMYSPRAAGVLTPTERDTLKAIWTQSVRMNFEAEMKKQHDATGTDSDPEKLDSWELRYERQQTKNLDLAVSGYLHRLNAISWDNSLQKSTVVGTQKDAGVELEAIYHTEKDRLAVSHGFTKLVEFDQKTGRTSHISSEPYGHDLTNWSNNNTKVDYRHKLDDHWTFNGSLRVYWGFPGLKTYEDWNSPVLVDHGWERTYRGSYFLDLGLEYKPNKHLEIGMYGYNLLGIFDSDLNKRNTVESGNAGGSGFRSAAPALAVSATYAF